MRWSALILAGAAGLAACATGAPDDRPAPYADQTLDRFTWPSLERFRSEGEFRAYMVDARAAAERRGMSWWAGSSPAYAALDQNVVLKALEECDPKLGCPEEGGEERIVVTGSRIAPSPITNVQEAGVDEGDIVKQIGDFLVVLQDGRLFSVALRPGGDEGLALAGRRNVYRSAEEDTWYDEMLVSDRRIVVTGYSYDENATEFSVLTLEEDGGFTREAVFYVSSDDYYDSDNYATRLVGDLLVVHTPIYLAGVNPYDPVVWPVVRRWREEGAKGQRADDLGRELFDARDIYKPLQRTLLPTLHTVSVCPIAEVTADDGAPCRTTAVVGPQGYDYYVSETDVWLWLYPDYEEGGELDWDAIDCDAPDAGDRPTFFEHGAPAVLYRVPLNGRAPEAIEVRGAPIDQFSLDASEDEFRALLVQWPNDPCIEGLGEQQLAYFRTPIRALDSELRQAPDHAYTIVPSPGGYSFENRFTDTHLVYAGRDSYGSRAPDYGDPEQTSRLIALPLDAPESPVVMTLPHNVIRLEQAGSHAVATGYFDDSGLRVSVVDLRGGPRLGDTATLPGRYESEGRSHAFNSIVGADGSGMLGVPTIVMPKYSGRWAWRSWQSDVSFLTVSPDAELKVAGQLEMSLKRQDTGYACEVSCVDWYGNSRPIFTDGRVFALSGIEIIEGEVVDGRIREIRRLDLTGPTPAVVAELTQDR